MGESSSHIQKEFKFKCQSPIKFSHEYTTCRRLTSAHNDNCNLELEVAYRVGVAWAWVGFVACRRFLPARRYASAGLCDSEVSVCPSVCLTHAGIVRSRGKAGP